MAGELQNQLPELGQVDYRYEESSFGRWRRFMYPDGQVFSEFVSSAKVLGLPLVHITRGKCPETGRRIVARGVFAFGRLSIGIVAVGHASAGLVAIGQAAFGLLFGLGQLSTGVVAVGQAAFGLAFGLGQLATGYTCIGQFGLGNYVLAQFGLGQHVWDTTAVDPIARSFFRWLIP